MKIRLEGKQITIFGLENKSDCNSRERGAQSKKGFKDVSEFQGIDSDIRPVL